MRVLVILCGWLGSACTETGRVPSACLFQYIPAHFHAALCNLQIPILKGAKRGGVGPFTPQAELLNGRAAM